MNAAIKLIIPTAMTFVVTSALFCVFPEGDLKLAGNSQDVTTANGVLYEPGGAPAKNASVVMRSSDYLPKIQPFGKRTTNNGFFVCSKHTDSMGFYSFSSTNDSIPDGMYCIEGRGSNDNCVLIDSITILGSGAKSCLLSDTLKPPISIQGKIHRENDSTTAYVLVYGLDIYAKVNPDNTFSLKNLPAGNFRMEIFLARENGKPDDSLTFVAVQGDSRNAYSIDIVTDSDTVVDIDGNRYGVVKIGNQTWMAENLRTTRYNDGTAIPLVQDSAEWVSLTEPGYYATVYKLYNWYAVNTGKLAPVGWHIPTYAEWDTLQNYLIAQGYNWDGTTTGNKIAKSLAAQSNWNVSTNRGAIGNDLTKNNRSGFSAFPCGYLNNYGSYVSDLGYWWSSTNANGMEAWNRYLHYDKDMFSRTSANMKCGYSIRCVRNQ